MSDTPKAISDLYTNRFGDRVTVGGTLAGITTLEVRADAWLEVCRALRDEDDFCFEQLTDLCGVDYLGYGQSEWDAEDASHEGFSRGIEALGPGRFAWDDRPEASDVEHRFAVAVHLLTLPTELDASFGRAMPVLEKHGVLYRNDAPHARRLLKAAAMTYVAASLMSLLNIARWWAILRR